MKKGDILVVKQSVQLYALSKNDIIKIVDIKLDPIASNPNVTIHFIFLNGKKWGTYSVKRYPNFNPNVREITKSELRMLKLKKINGSKMY